MTSVPSSRGTLVVTTPKPSERKIFCRNSVRLSSSPAKNISSSMPTSEKNCRTGCCWGKISSTCGPNSTPARSSPTASGRWMRRDTRGMMTISIMQSANLANTGRTSTALCRYSRKDMRVFPDTTYFESLTYSHRIRHMHQELWHVGEPADERVLFLPFRREALHALLEPFGHIEISIWSDRKAGRRI